MTSVPKPLKFLFPHYISLVKVFDTAQLPAVEKAYLADVLSILAMSRGDEEADKRMCLKYRMQGSTQDPLSSWGHEYVRHLSTEIMAEFNYRQSSDVKDCSDLLKMAHEMVPFFVKHNAEADACDLLLELESLPTLVQYLDLQTYARVCLYLTSCSSYLPAPEDINTLRIVHDIYRKFNQWTRAISIALKINDLELIKQDFSACPDAVTKKQIAYLLARQMINIDVEDEQLAEILSNSHLSTNFLALARDLDVLEPKIPEDIYKSHLENIRPTMMSVGVDSAKQNLSATFVNAFVNCGFGNDKLMVQAEEGSAWIYKNKDHGMMSAAASLGMVMLWDVEGGLTQIDKYLYSKDDHIKAGALLAIGIVNSGVRNEADPAIALLSEHINDPNVSIRVASIVGMGIAYAGSDRQDVVELLTPIISDTGLSMELCSFAALAAGLICVGTCNGELTSVILQTMMEREEAQLKDTYSRYMALGLGLLYLGKQDAAEATLETLKVIEHALGKQALVLVQGCAYTGTGNVLKVQEMLHHCNDHAVDKEKTDDAYQGFATLAIAMISLGEEIGSQMALRTFNHLMHYGEPHVRRAVPLAIGLLCASNPLINVMETLSRFSHDHDQEVALNATFALGLIGAGTNNARLAQMLRQLAVYYHKDASCLSMVRIAQGLIAMGKGTVSINPFHSNRFLMSPVAAAGLLTTIISFTDVKGLILGNSHFTLYHLAMSVFPRFLITLNEEGVSVPVTVRVGQAVDTVGQAGRPKTITGFQTHTTPVLLAYSERAELATEEYLPVSHVLEGFVILKKNPDYEAEEVVVKK